jgi:hypothetical protein
MHAGGAIIVKVSLREEVFEVVSESGLQITLSRADLTFPSEFNAHFIEDAFIEDLRGTSGIKANVSGDISRFRRSVFYPMVILAKLFPLNVCVEVLRERMDQSGLESLGSRRIRSFSCIRFSCSDEKKRRTPLGYPRCPWSRNHRAHRRTRACLGAGSNRGKDGG